MRLAAALPLLLTSAAAFGHDADIIYAQVQRTAGSAEVVEILTLTPSTLLLLAPVDENRDGAISEAELSARKDAIAAGVWESLPMSAGGVRCPRTEEQARIKETYLELRARFRCAEGELIQQFRVLSVLPRNYKVVLGTFVDGEAGQRFAQGHEQTLLLDEPGARGLSGLWSWVKLGLEHIFKGPDHLAFVIALLLTAKSLKRVLLMVTSFTVAHSITLGLTAAGVLTLSAAHGRWVELAIALSIIWIAAENVILKAPRHRTVLTFVFGLVHGFGFASSLREYGIERELLTALFGFNAGVELGQAAVVLVVTPAVFYLRTRPRLWPHVLRAASLIIAAAGGYWLVVRAVG